MKKLLLILLCVPLIGVGQNKKELKIMLSQKNDSLKFIEEQLLIQNNHFLDKLKVQEHSLSVLKKEILDLKEEVIDLKEDLNTERNNHVNNETINIFKMNVTWQSGGQIVIVDEEEFNYIIEEYEIVINKNTCEVINGEVLVYYDDNFLDQNYPRLIYNFKDGKLFWVEEYILNENEYFLFTKVEYINGKREGKFKMYYDNSKQLRKEISYKNGEYDGEYISYWINGNQREVGLFKKGKPIGIYKSFYEKNGVLSNEEYYLENPSSNDNSTLYLEKWYYENKQIRKEREYGDNGYERCWDEEGNEIDCK